MSHDFKTTRTVNCDSRLSPAAFRSKFLDTSISSRAKGEHNLRAQLWFTSCDRFLACHWLQVWKWFLLLSASVIDYSPLQCDDPPWSRCCYWACGKHNQATNQLIMWSEKAPKRNFQHKRTQKISLLSPDWTTDPFHSLLVSFCNLQEGSRVCFFTSQWRPRRNVIW